MGTPTNVLIGPGLLYVAPIGTAEPASATATLDAAFRASATPRTATSSATSVEREAIEVAEEFDPIKYKTTVAARVDLVQDGRDHPQNLALALNMGADAANTGTIEPPDVGAEVRVMILLETEDGAKLAVPPVPPGRPDRDVSAARRPARRSSPSRSGWRSRPAPSVVHRLAEPQPLPASSEAAAMTYRDFDAAVAEADDEPITFTAAGRKFTARRGGAGPLLNLARLAATDETVDLGKALAVFEQFISSLIVEKDEWADALNELTLTQVTEIAQWLVQEMTGRPTERQSPSDVLPSNSGPPSNGDSTQPTL
jgi:hypothetical protein